MKLPANLKFNNYPQQFKIEDYQEVLNLAVEDLKKNKDVLAVYSMGQNWVPGLSDLDVIVVYRDGVLKLHSRDPRTLSEKAGYIFTHDYMHFNVSSFKNLYYIYPDRFSLKLLFGENIELSDPQKELSEKEYQLLEASLTMDFLVTKLLLLPRFFMADAKEVSPINVREMLLFLYSFTHTVAMVERITGEKVASNFPEEIKSLKDSWFINTKEENNKLLQEAMINGFEVTAILVEKFDNYFKANFNLDKLPAKPLFVSPTFYIAGVKKWDKEEFWKTFLGGTVKVKMPILGKMLKNYKLLVPSSFFAMFSLYAKEQGAYSNWFRMFLKCRGCSLTRSLGIAKRLEVLNSTPLKKNKEALFTLPFHYGFYTTNYFKEAIRVKVVLLKRFLKQ